MKKDFKFRSFTVKSIIMDNSIITIIITIKIDYTIKSATTNNLVWLTQRFMINFKYTNYFKEPIL